MPRNHRKPDAMRSKSAKRIPAPSHVDELANAQNLYHHGRIPEAETAYKRILKLDKHCVPALAALAMIMQQYGDFEKALKFLQRGIKVDASNPALRLELAKTYLARGDTARALSASDRARALEDGFEVQCVRAEIFERAADPDKAIAAYHSALAIRGDVAEVHNNLGILYRQRRDFSSALRHFDCALEINPRNLAAHNNRGNTLKDLCDYDGAMREYLLALDLNPKHIDTLFNLALCHQRNGDMTKALTRLREISEIAPKHESARIQIVESLISLGRFEEADVTLDELLSATPESGHGWYLKAALHKFNNFDAGIFGPITELLKTGGCDEDTAIFLNFALGKLYDDIGDPDRAFENYGAANAARRLRSADSGKADLALANALLKSRADDWRSEQNYAVHGSPDLIFIVGMPRSGTTLTEQIIAAHSKVTAGGEVNFFDPALRHLAEQRGFASPADITADSLDADDCETLRTAYLARLNSIAPGAAVVTDKTPANYYYLGLIQRLFPDARVIHCNRHPLDTCVSIYFQLFDSIEYAYDLGDIGDHYLAYESLMSHWRSILDSAVFELQYETLVAQPEDSINALLTHCELPLEAQCLKPNEAERPVNTPSRWQVRQPLYRHAVQRWKRYEKHLTELKRKLDPVLGNAAYPGE